MRKCLLTGAVVAMAGMLVPSARFNASAQDAVQPKSGETARPQVTPEARVDRATSPRLNASHISSGSARNAVIDHSLECADTQAVVADFPIKNCLKVRQVYGSASTAGIRQAIEGYSILRSPTAPSNRLRYYVGGSFTAEAQAGDGGFATTIAVPSRSGATDIHVASAARIMKGDILTLALSGGLRGTAYQQVVAGTPAGTIVPISPALTRAISRGADVIVSKGELQGAIAQAVNRSASPYLDAVVGFESNITVEQGAAPRIKIWNSNVNNATDRETGLQWDAAIGLSSSSPTTHSRTGILFSPYGGYFPVEPTGTLLGAYSGAQGTLYKVAQGIDMTGVEITGSALAAQVNTTQGIAPSTTQPGFAIQGNMSGGSAEINLVNSYENAPLNLSLLQKTGASTYEAVMQVTGKGDLTTAGSVHASKGVRLPATKVGQLPSCDGDRAGLMFFVVDAQGAPAYRDVARGGGATRVNVTCDGINWLYM